MTFHNWFENQPNFNGKNEFVLEYMRKNWGSKVGFNDQNPAVENQFYLLEWSQPSKRNYPGQPQKQSTEFKVIEELRDNLRDRHGRSYARIRKKNDKLVSDWVKDAKRWIERGRDLDEGFATSVLATLDTADAAHKLPDQVPQFAPKALKRSHKEAKEKIGELWLDYAEHFEDAKSDYLESLREEGIEARSKGEDALTSLISRELRATAEDDLRIHIILDGEHKLPAPEAK